MYLEAGTFQWPERDKDAQQLEIDVTQLSLIINGIESAKRRVRYRENARPTTNSQLCPKQAMS
jgi:hypothetical protein